MSPVRGRMDGEGGERAVGDDILIRFLTITRLFFSSFYPSFQGPMHMWCSLGYDLFVIFFTLLSFSSKSYILCKATHNTCTPLTSIFWAVSLCLFDCQNILWLSQSSLLSILILSTFFHLLLLLLLQLLLTTSSPTSSSVLLITLFLFLLLLGLHLLLLLQLLLT